MKLTPRQLEVLCLAAYSGPQVAVRLGISLHTVRNHWVNIYDRILGEHRERGTGDVVRTRALTTALRAELIELNEIDYGRPIMERRLEDGTKL